MATIDYAKKYSGQVVEKFTEGAKSNGVLSNEFDFSGVKSVLVYNVGQVTLQNYNRKAEGDRFGFSVFEGSYFGPPSIPYL